MRTQLATLLALTLTALAPRASAQQASLPPSCPALAPEVSIEIGEPTYDRQMSVAQLAAAAGDRKEAHASREMVMGFYQARMQVASLASAETYAAPSGSPVIACFARMRLTVRSIPEIHIAREIAPGSCSDQAVSAHEYTHHRIQLAKSAEAVAAYIQRNPIPSQPVRASSAAEAKALIARYAQAYAETLGASLDNYIEPAQFAFDSPQEYARIGSLCSVEMRALMLRQPR